MEVSSDVSSKALLDLWGINDDDIKRYRICRKLTDPLLPSYKGTEVKENYICTIPSSEPVSDREINVLDNADRFTDHGALDKFEAPTGISEEQDEDTDLCKHYSPINHIQPLESDATKLNDSHPSSYPCSPSDLRHLRHESAVESRVIDVCDWCHCVNELRLSWCENCGRVINKDQQYSSSKEPLNSDTHILDSSHHGNTQTNFTSLGDGYISTKTSRCTRLQAHCDSYQRHWKKSSYYFWMKPSSSIDLVNSKVDRIPPVHLAQLKHKSINTRGGKSIDNDIDGAICALPDEVLLRIFSYLPRSSLLVCSLTCRRLNMIATDPSLWKDIELWKISDNILTSVAKRKPIRLTLKYCSAKLTPSCIKECFTIIGQKLQYLRIDCCVFDDESQLLTTVGVVCPRLQALHLDHVITNVIILQHIVNNCTQLKDLTLIGTGVTMLSISHLLHCHGDRLSSIRINIIQ